MTGETFTPRELERLTLRFNHPDDLEDTLRFQERDDVTRYIPWKSRSRAEVERVLIQRQQMKTLVNSGDAIVLAVVIRETGELIGEMYLFLKDRESSQGEIGYLIHPDFHGRGYATEAARGMLELGFTHFGMHRIVARCDARNVPSQRVMQRLGMRLEAHLRENELFKGEWSDEIVYAMLAREWKAQQKSDAGG